MKRSTTLCLVGLNVLLACLLAWLWINPQGGLRGVHWQPPVAIKPDLGSLSGIAVTKDDADVSRFMAILDRPVFSAGRRPPPPPKAGGSVADPLDGIHLYGLFSGSEGGGIIARVEGKTRRVKVSEALGEWSLKQVRDRDVVFSRGAETRVVPLVQAKQAAGTPAARPAVAAPMGQPVPAAAAAPAPAVPAPAAAAPPAPVPNRVTAPAPPSAPATAPPAQSPAAAPGAKSANPFVIGGSR